ncbi:MAG: hypothetical protein HOV71_27070 [Hamadaea sp.]|nr:hypothetical protein [Hamadaea sp.]NUR51804.1 hypothetical protein [Hamadaea sp.]NUT07263.1 hypothetical protein [Hamadaea sp.]
MTDQPRLIGDATAIVANADTAGAVWRVTAEPRHLDANIIHLPAGDRIAAHQGPDLDVLIHVLAGGGHLDSDDQTLELAPGALVWLPRGSQRAVVAGPDGLTYFSVHPKRPPLGITRPS